MIAAIAQWEGEMIGERTKAALAAKKQRDPDCLRRPEQAVSKEVVTAVVRWRELGYTYKAIAGLLEDQGVPTAQGGKWHASSVRWIYKSHKAQEEVV
jgi:DNA invertase Pin-like site-specific DNA recombinase